MMESRINKTLPHLEESIPKEVFGYPISMYSVALEGWRRGLSLKFISGGRVKATTIYKLSYKEKELQFSGIRPEIVTNKAIKICNNKNLTKEYLAKAKISITEGKTFNNEHSFDEIVTYAHSLDFPVVIKPTNASGGKGVIANIKNKVEFVEALNYVKEELGFKDIIVEKHFEGKDYRVFVVGNQVVGVIHRIPANVIGDGKSTLSELIKNKLNERAKNPAIKNSPIINDKEMDNILSENIYTMESIPMLVDMILLKTKSNISAGGDPIDVIDNIVDEVIENAVNAVKAIPGLFQGGVDVLYNKKTGESVVLEINTQPSIRTHLFPMEGYARDIPKAIIDYYFTETKNNNVKSFLYFDMKNVFKLFQSGVAKEIIIPDHPTGELSSFCMKISGDISKRQLSLQNFLQKQAKKLKISGSIKHLKYNEIIIIASGSQQTVQEFKSIIICQLNNGMKVKEMTEENWNRPVKMGFEILTSKTQKKRRNEKKKVKIEQEIESLKKEAIFYKEKYLELKNRDRKSTRLNSSHV